MLLGVRADVAEASREGQGRTPGQHSVAPALVLVLAVLVLVLGVVLEILALLLDILVQTVRH